MFMIEQQSLGNPYVYTLGLKDVAEFDEKGKNAEKVKFPWRLVF